VLSQRTLKLIADYWSADFGCPAKSLLAQPLHLLTHGPSLADYNGIFALFREGKATVSFPPAAFDSLQKLLPSPPITPADFAKAYDKAGFRVVGPACLSYAEQVPSPVHQPRALTEDVRSALDRLQAACGPTEWNHGGSDPDSAALSGVFAGEELVSLAGYKVWGKEIAHISVITHPAHRGKGFAQGAVAHVARAALDAELIPQYRTLESNGPSMSVAKSLGFVHYATSVAVKMEA
jgi:hypothetical protein